MNLGIIPAAGKATRFGGVLKELLPLPGGGTPLELAVRRLYLTCDAVVIVTSPDKVEQHMRAIGDMGVLFRVQIGDEIISAIQCGMAVQAERYYMTMPDTLMPENVFESDPGSDLALGVFSTSHPERFGVIDNGKIIDKPKDYAGLLPAFAWGTVTWSENVRALWERYEVDTFPDALNMAIRKYGFETHRIDYYHDLARLEDYTNYLKGQPTND